MLSIFRCLMKNRQGATALEYTLIASLAGAAALQVGALTTGPSITH
jgi:Flp pilus assembly pilin Flp